MIGRPLAVLGFASAALILTGDLIPFDVPGTDAANFIGYVLWSVWLVLLGVVFIRRGGRAAAPLCRPTAHSRRRLAAVTYAG